MNVNTKKLIVIELHENEAISLQRFLDDPSCNEDAFDQRVRKVLAIKLQNLLKALSHTEANGSEDDE